MVVFASACADRADVACREICRCFEQQLRLVSAIDACAARCVDRMDGVPDSNACVEAGVDLPTIGGGCSAADRYVPFTQACGGYDVLGYCVVLAADFDEYVRLECDDPSGSS